MSFGGGRSWSDPSVRFLKRRVVVLNDGALVEATLCAWRPVVGLKLGVEVGQQVVLCR